MLPYITIGNVSIPSGLFFWGIGIFFCIIYYAFFSRAPKISCWIRLVFGFVIILAEMIGAKLLFLLENPDNFIETISWSSGYSFFGVLLFTPFILSLIAWLSKIKVFEFLDFFAPGILIELAWYRIGCMYAGCCYGIQVGWGISNGQEDGLFPVQPLEAALDLALFLFIVIAWKRLKMGERPLLATGITYAGYGLIRFVLEFLRHREVVWLGMSVSSFLALGTLVIGVIAIVFSLTRKEKTLVVQETENA